ncbi:hypothetical protein K0M31_002395, partial [Melipona bicolor]
ENMTDKKKRNEFPTIFGLPGNRVASFFSVNLSGSGSWQIATVFDVSLDFDVTTDSIKTYERAAPALSTVPLKFHDA